MALPELSLGKVTFTPDEARSATALLDSESVTVSVTDASGTEWSLFVPEQVGMDAVTIRLIPLSAVDSDGGSPLTAGVLFEPDGLMFSDPATLTITPPSGATAGIPYVFDGDGSNLWYALHTESKISVSHFSGAATGPSPTPEDLCAEATRDFNAAAAAAKQITGDVAVPSPPSIEMACWNRTDNARGRLASLWARTVVEPEQVAMTKILAAGKQMVLACAMTDSQLVYAALNPLWNRLDKKVNLLIALPRKPETYFPIAMVELMIARWKDLIGAASITEKVLSDIAGRGQQARTELLRRLREEHDYAMVGAILKLARDIQLLGTGVTDNTRTELARAFRFQVEVAIRMQVDFPGRIGSNGDELWGIFADDQIEGSGTLAFDSKLLGSVLQPESLSLLTLQGKEGSRPRPSFDDYDTFDLVSAAPYTVSFALALNACDPASTSLTMDRMGTVVNDSTETWKFWYHCPGAPEMEFGDIRPGGTGGMSMLVFQQYFSAKADSFVFRPTLTNRQAVAIRNDFGASLSSPQAGVGMFSLTVTHTPQ